MQVDWRAVRAQTGPGGADFGADDLDGVSPVDDAALGPRRGPVEEVRRNIVAAGFTPVERDGTWAPLLR